MFDGIEGYANVIEACVIAVNDKLITLEEIKKELPCKIYKEIENKLKNK